MAERSRSQGRHRRLLAAALLAAACAEAPAPPPAALPAELVAQYDGSGPGLLSLELREDGRYEGFVLVHIVDGCGTVEGNGSTRGRWGLVDGRVHFQPEQEGGFGGSQLAISLEGAVAAPTPEGLRVRVGSQELAMRRRP